MKALMGVHAEVNVLQQGLRAMAMCQGASCQLSRLVSQRLCLMLCTALVRG